MWNQFGLNENLFDFQKIFDSEGIHENVCVLRFIILYLHLITNRIRINE